MKLTRAILCGALLWVLIFFEVSILMFGFGLNNGLNYYIMHYLLSGILAFLVALFYFRKMKKGVGEGLLVAFTFLITGIILDAAITVPLFVKNYSFFLNIYMILGYIEGLLIVFVVGSLKK